MTAANFRASGSITTLADGSSFLKAGSGITVVTNSNDSITISTAGGGGGADPTANYVIVGAATGTLSNERVLGIGSGSGAGLILTDNGGGSTAIISVNNSILATVSGTQFSGKVGMSGTLSLRNDVRFASTVTGTIAQSPTTIGTVTGAPLTIRAQSATGASTTGGKLILSGGDATSIGGNVEIYAGRNTLTSIAGKVILSGSVTEVTGGLQVNAFGAHMFTMDCLNGNPNYAEIKAIPANGIIFTANAGSQVFNMRASAAGGIYLDSTKLYLRDSNLANISAVWNFANAGPTQLTHYANVTSVTHSQHAGAGGLGANHTYQAQSMKGVAGFGGHLILSAGNGTSLGGDVRIYAGRTTSGSENQGVVFVKGAILRIDSGSTTLLEIKDQAGAGGVTTQLVSTKSFLLNSLGSSVQLISDTSQVSLTALTSNLFFSSAPNGGTTQFIWRGDSYGTVRTDTMPISGECSMAWASTVKAVSHSQNEAGTGDGAPTFLRAQNASAASSVGGRLVLSGGDGAGTGGNVEITSGQATGAGTTRGGNLILSGGRATTHGGDIELIAGSGSTAHGKIELRFGKKNMGYFKYDADPRFVTDGAAPYFLFEANAVGQGLYFQSIASGGSVNFQTPTVYFSDANASICITNALNATAATTQTYISTTTASIVQASTAVNTVTGAPLTIRAQNATGTTNTVGGTLVLSGGEGVLGGNVKIYAGHSHTGNTSNDGTIYLQAPVGYWSDPTATACIQYTLSATGVTTEFFANTTTASISQANTTIATVTAAPLTLRAQTATGASTTGGKLLLSGGNGVSTGGNVEIYGGQGTGAGVTGQVIISGSLIQIKGETQVTGSFSANTKSFLIPHPTKDGMLLQYGCLEGPEHGVYVRGKCSGNRNATIPLPEYWKKLVNIESELLQ